jgi:hypothetical protein
MSSKGVTVETTAFDKTFQLHEDASLGFLKHLHKLMKTDLFRASRWSISYTDMSVTITFIPPDKLGSAPAGSHDFARGWLSYAAIHQLNTFFSDHKAWEEIRYSTDHGRVMSRTGKMVET